jgi:hypothetical protein
MVRGQHTGQRYPEGPDRSKQCCFAHYPERGTEYFGNKHDNCYRCPCRHLHNRLFAAAGYQDDTKTEHQRHFFADVCAFNNRRIPVGYLRVSDWGISNSHCERDFISADGQRPFFENKTWLIITVFTPLLH